MDDKHIRDLAVIGLNFVTGGKDLQGNRISDEMITLLKRNHTSEVRGDRGTVLETYRLVGQSSTEETRQEALERT